MSPTRQDITTTIHTAAPGAIAPEQVTLRDGRVVTLRSVVDGDAPRLLEYLDAVRREAPYILYCEHDTLPTLEQEQAWVRGHLGADALVLVAESDGSIIAAADISRASRHKIRHRADLGIGIREPWRGVGLGRMLMDRLIAWARRHEGIALVRLSVYSDNAVARRLYERCGFVVEGVGTRAIRQPDGRFMDEVQMALWLGDEKAVSPSR